MTNDLSTLSGALLEMKDQLIYELGQKGVTASYSSSTGLLGLIGEISNIQTGSSCYHIKFDSSSYTAINGSITVSATLQQNYSTVSGETVTFSASGISQTVTTDSNGVATTTLTGLTSDITLTVSYSNVSDTCSITVVNYLFYDACDSSTGLSNYGSIIQVENSTSATMTYDSTMNAYLLSSTGSGMKIFPVNALDGLTQLKFSMELYVPSNANSSTSPCIEIATVNKTSVGYGFSTEANRLIRHRFANGSWKENYNVSGSNTIVKGEWCYYECSVNGTSVTANVYRADKTTLVGTNTYTLTNNSTDYNTSTNRRYGVGIGWSNGAYGYVRNIKAETL